MAIYHLSVKTISRSAGRSATAAAAYRAGVEILDARTGEVHDYRRKGGVEHSEIVLPKDAPDWARDRAALWNAAEVAEVRKNSTVAREFEIALPSELSGEARRALAVDFAREIVGRHGCAVDVSIHEPGREGDSRNHHAHLLLTTRRLGSEGFTEKTRELDQRQSGEVDYWRSRYAELQNERLMDAGLSVRVDHRSLKAQGVDREPTRHLGVGAVGYERRTGQASRRRLTHEAEITERLQLAKEAGELARAGAVVDQTILDLSGDLERAKAEHRQQVSDKYGLKAVAQAVERLNVPGPTGQEPAKKLTIANLYGVESAPKPEEKPEVVQMEQKPETTEAQVKSEHGWGVKIAGLKPVSEQQPMPEIQEREEPKETRPMFDIQAYLQHVELSVDRWKKGQASKEDAARINKFADVYWKKRHKIYEQIKRCSTKARRLWDRLNERLTEHHRRKPQKPTGMGAIFKQGDYKESFGRWQDKEIELDRRFRKIDRLHSKFASMSWNDGWLKLADKKMGERFTERACLLHQSIERETQRRKVAAQNRLNEVELEPKRGPRR
ncbi:MobQ family relaxase [Fluviibacter phosphoraccumulans]|uniref:MobA/MobL protein domain-containing protein n=1 Tax=Fluviibacter phosphoraccumulans TaxID=1751046 RepID=A0A7R6R6G2_9RHOO|nr:MobQ family relaxase [Fluviibacter phosphoraccumulans]BBU70064.1 hypothetical protein ICHIAU1_P010 [Fluviibacter phosphoraccumulans]